MKTFEIQMVTTNGPQTEEAGTLCQSEGLLIRSVAVKRELKKLGLFTGSLKSEDCFKWNEIHPEDSDEDWPTNRVFHNSIVVENELYLFGGWSYEADHCTNDLYKLNLKSFKWTRLRFQNGPSPRRWPSSVTYQGSVVIFGGHGGIEDDEDGFQDMWSLKIKPDQPGEVEWEEISIKGFQPFPDMNFYQIGDEIIAMDSNEDSFHRFSFGSKTWTKIEIEGGEVSGLFEGSVY